MFCTKFGRKLKDLFKKFDDFLRNNVDTALKVTTGIKLLLDSPLTSLITQVIPGDWDDKIAAKAKLALGKAIDTLALVDKCIKVEPFEEKLLCFARELKLLSPAMQQAVLHKLASHVASELDGNRFKRNQYDAFVQGVYTTNK